MAIAQRSPVAVTAAPRAAARHRVAIPARLTWKDASGAVRFASVTTRDVSDTGAFVECAAQAPIPLFRLVHLQLESADPLTPSHLRGARTLAAVWRVESPRTRQGAPCGYALRFMIDPAQAHAAAPAAASAMAVAS
ncbi:MAG: PilZ domain-containing protein [Vicinamibacterales bacterium]